MNRPNILCIVSEDASPFLGCYGDKFASTPNLDRLAAEGVVYENAFADAPVSAPARCSLITGVYANSLGTLHMRSSNRIPTHIFLFPKYLRERGYFCSNRSKTDYNIATVPSDSWDQIRDGHWKDRRPGQPFFSVFNIDTTHESSLHESSVKQEFLREEFELPPYHPDTPEIRSNWVEYYRIMTIMDQQAGELLEQLEQDGLAENTIVFYYSDHGGILPRSKRFLFDSGTRVPLIVRFPKRYQHLAPSPPGSRSDRLVSLVDLGPTILSLLEIEIPDYMQGRAFLGVRQTSQREFVYLFRGRTGERYDMMRAVRDKQYKYIRNYLPHRIYGQHVKYLWKMPATVFWEEAYRSGSLTKVQRAFWEPKPAEELYDVNRDSHEVENLADDPTYQEVLCSLRRANREHLVQICDAGFLSESEMMIRSGEGSIYDVVHDSERYPLERIMEVAELAANRDLQTLPRLIRWLADDEPAVCYWAAVGCVVRGRNAGSAAAALQKCLRSRSPSVRIASAEALCLLNEPDEALVVLTQALEHDRPRVVLEALNVLDNIGQMARPALKTVKQLLSSGRDRYVQNVSASILSRLDDLPL